MEIKKSQWQLRILQQFCVLGSLCCRWGERNSRIWSALELKLPKRWGFLHLLYRVCTTSGDYRVFITPDSQGHLPTPWHVMQDGIALFPKDTGIHTVLMLLTSRILQTLAHSKQTWESSKCFMDTEIWVENGDLAGRTSVEYVHSSLIPENSAVSGRVNSKPQFSPKAELHRKPISVTVWLEVVALWKTSCSHRSSLASEIPRVPHLGKRIHPWDPKEWRFKFNCIFQV